jgi:hypothetical protein
MSDFLSSPTGSDSIPDRGSFYGKGFPILFRLLASQSGMTREFAFLPVILIFEF